MAVVKKLRRALRNLGLFSALGFSSSAYANQDQEIIANHLLGIEQQVSPEFVFDRNFDNVVDAADIVHAQQSYAAFHRFTLDVPDSDLHELLNTEIIQTANQPASIITNIPNFPVVGYFSSLESVISENGSAWLTNHGFREDIFLSEGLNVVQFRFPHQNRTVQRNIVLDPNYSTQDRELLYFPISDETLVLDLSGNHVLGVLPGLEINAVTPNLEWAAANPRWIGNTALISTRDHATTITLPVQTDIYHPAFPIFSEDGSYAFVRNFVIEMASNAVIRDDFPEQADNRFGSISGNILTMGYHAAGSTQAEFRTIDVTNDTLIRSQTISDIRVIPGDLAVDPTGLIGISSTFSYATGMLAAVDMVTGEVLVQTDRLGDYMGVIDFSRDGQYMYVGSEGNSYWGLGGVYIYDMATLDFIRLYSLYGAGIIKVLSEDRMAVSSRYTIHNGEMGFFNRRGADILRIDGDSLEFDHSIFLNHNTGYSYSSAGGFVHKPAE